MQKTISIYHAITNKLNSLSALPLLLLRGILAYGFYGPATMKWKNIHDIASWFSTLGIPAPVLNAYLAASTEAVGVVLLILGLGTRIIAVPLIITLLVAIKTVHWANGFEAGDNGFEIPLYYILMLVTLIIFGAGRFSLDYLISKRLKK
jgi:putative oxidoreductase